MKQDLLPFREATVQARGTFGLSGNTGFWWTSTEYGAGFALYRYIYYNTGSLLGGDMDKHNGFSVRCMKN